MLGNVIALVREIRLGLEQAFISREVKRLINSTAFSSVANEKELGFQDPFVTQEQMKRDAEITKLLEAYVKAYQKKVWHSSICRYMILIPCILVIVALAGVLGYFTISIFALDACLYIEDVVAFVTACISFVSLIIGLLTIITKYFFPENDEQYITKIVEAIQKNDLENKKENAKYRLKVSENMEEDNPQ